MAINRTFTALADHYVATAVDTYLLDFLGGDDTLIVQAGTVTSEMGAGNDFVRVAGGLAKLFGQDGNDRFDVYSSGARINGGSGDDLFNIRGGSNYAFTGRDGNDRFNFLSDAMDVRLAGDSGNDLFVGYGRSIDGQLYGGDGNDRFLLFGNHDGREADLYGGAGNDLYRLDAGSPANVFETAGEGTDTVQIFDGATYVLPENVEILAVIGASSVGEGADLTGNAAANRISGWDNIDYLRGLGGNDRLYGGGGGDTIEGGDGNDLLHGGLGLDSVVGGAGADRFVYLSAAEIPAEAWATGSWDMDWIGDMQAGDRIDLSAIDANTELAGEQAFKLVANQGDGSFTGVGTVYVAFGHWWGEGYLVGYTDSDAVADILIGIWPAEGESFIVEDLIIL